MSIILATRPEVKPSRPARPFGQGIDTDPTLAIRGVRYSVQSFTGDEGEAGVALTKADGTSYHVVATAHAIECDCPDYIWTRAERGEQCKHIRSVIGAGLITEPVLARTTTPAPVAKAVEQVPAPEPTTAAIAPAVEQAPTVESRTWTAIEWLRADYFGFKSPAGMKRPTAPRPAPVVEVKAVEPTPAPTAAVPATVARIRIVSGAHSATYRAVPSGSGRVWEAETGPDAWIADEAVTALNPTGRVEVLPEPAPVEEEAPKATAARTRPAGRRLRTSPMSLAGRWGWNWRSRAPHPATTAPRRPGPSSLARPGLGTRSTPITTRWRRSSASARNGTGSSVSTASAATSKTPNWPRPK